jgi:cell division protease FtsH
MSSPEQQPPGSRDPISLSGLVIVAALIAAMALILDNTQEPPTPTYSEFVAQVERGQIREVTVKPGRNSLEVRPHRDAEYDAAYPSNTEAQLLAKLRDHGVAIQVEPKPAGWGGPLLFILPMALLLIVWIVMIRRANGMSASATRMTRSRARRADIDSPKITFRDVAGADEAVEELHEIKGVPGEPEEVPGAGRAHPQGRAAVRPARHRQDAAGPCGRR